jgi:hypothetical protein
MWTALGALAALLPALWMWGFTVDDALISVRYARHLAGGSGWRFNLHGPSTDGVTPLPWPLLLAPLARADALAVLARSKTLGLVAWVATGAGLGRAVGRVDTAAWIRGSALATMALSVPLAAYAVSGMETALATALATFAVLRMDRPRLSALLAGLASSLRPEMAPWACALAVGAVGSDDANGTPARAARRSLEACTLALTPFALCALIRALVWGHPAPLALLAKPSDVAHGLAYAGAACVVSIVPILIVAPVSVARDRRALAIVVAALVQIAAIVIVGGDWMPYARLVVPIAPSLVYAAVLASRRAHPAASAARSVAALLLGVALVARGGTAGRTVGADRAALVAAARPWVGVAHRVAALDIGWVSAATEADIIDLAGLTDPEIAALPGGHTSKRVDARFLRARDPEVLLIEAPRGLPPGGLQAWQDTATPRAVEARLLDDDNAAHFTPAAWLPLGTAGSGYIVLRANRDPTTDLER